MNTKKWLALGLAVCLSLSLCACGGETAGVYVQSVAELSNPNSIAPGDRFAGILVSENVVEIRKDEDKTVKELLVKAGDDVQEGDVLFSYDTEQLQLNVDKQKLELEQLNISVASYTSQIKDLEKERDRAASGDKLAYTVQIQTLEVELKEASLNLDAKQKEIEKSEAVLENASVTSPVTGRIQSISESGTDNYGNAQAYITIQQSGAYRVKGTIGEQQMNSLREGDRMRILSRTDESQSWSGTVSLIDRENPTQGSGMNNYSGTTSDEMTTASRYPFYVELDSIDGLMLGQHVYMELDSEVAEPPSGVQVPSYFLCFDDDGSVYVWADNSGKLEKRMVTPGEYSEFLDSYEILEGLSETDCIAFPDEESCVEGAATIRESGVE